MKFLETVNEWTIFRLPGFYLARERGQFWFRFFGGSGLAIKDWSRCYVLLSERYDYGRTRRLRFGDWRLEFLH